MKPVETVLKPAAEITSHKSAVTKGGQLLRKLGRFLIKKETITETICALLIVLFLYTGMNKLWDYNEFKTQMGRSPFIADMSGFIAASLPAGEMLLALLLVIKKTRYLGLYLSFLLMLMFTGYIWLMLTYAPDLPCSCGGILAAMDWKDHLYFNAAFTVLAAAGMFLQGQITSRTRH